MRWLACRGDSALYPTGYDGKISAPDGFCRGEGGCRPAPARSTSDRVWLSNGAVKVLFRAERAFFRLVLV
jgi:hypothetical protein